MSEAKIAAAVVAHLQDLGGDVYQEVDVAGMGGVADIVAVFRGVEVWIVETKTTWSLDLLSQCLERVRLAHRVFAAVPQKRSSGPWVARKLGIGIMEVRLADPKFYRTADRVEVMNPLPPRLTSKPLPWIRKLQPEHKTSAVAGTASGGHWTPFRATCQAVRSAVMAEPGMTVTQLVKVVDHHYASPSSARASIAHWVMRGAVAGVEIRRDGRLLRCYPTPVEVAR